VRFDLDGMDDEAYHRAHEHQVKHQLNDDKDSGTLGLCSDVLLAIPLLPNPQPRASR
jgi:hypothetical protein